MLLTNMPQGASSRQLWLNDGQGISSMPAFLYSFGSSDFRVHGVGQRRVVPEHGRLTGIERLGALGVAEGRHTRRGVLLHQRGVLLGPRQCLRRVEQRLPVGVQVLTLVVRGPGQEVREHQQHRVAVGGGDRTADADAGDRLGGQLVGVGQHLGPGLGRGEAGGLEHPDVVEHLRARVGVDREAVLLARRRCTGRTEPLGRPARS